MSKKFIKILKAIASIFLLIVFEIYFYKILSIIGININDYSNYTKSIIDLVAKLVLSIIIYFIYKKDFHNRRSSNNVFKMILILFISVIGLTFIMYLLSYVINYLGDLFKINFISHEYYNILDKKIDKDLLINLTSNYILTPFLYTSIIILGVDKLIRRNDIYILLSGILASIIYSFKLNGTLLYSIINSLDIFIIFILLSMFYKKFNSIWFTIFLYSLYLISNGIILNYLGL